MTETANVCINCNDDLRDHNEHLTHDVIRADAARDTAIRERDEARGAAEEALEIARRATEVGGAAVTRAEQRQAKLSACDELVERWRQGSSPEGPVMAGRIRADELAAVLDPHAEQRADFEADVMSDLLK